MRLETNSPQIEIKAIQSNIILSVFTFKKVIIKNIMGNNKIVLGMSDSYHFF